MTTNISSSTNTNRSASTSLSNGYPSNASAGDNNNEEDQLNRINLQALQNRDPYISKIVDQAQRVCVYKFIAEKREWERKELEGTLFVYERISAPYHGFVILSTVSRETFVQIIKSSMEFKHSLTHEAFLQYKVDVGDIYGIWFISKNDCPRVTECLKRLAQEAKEFEQSTNENHRSTSLQKSNDIISLLNNAQDKFQETKPKQDINNSETSTAMPAVLLRLFSTQETSTVSIMSSDERGEELKKTLKISGKSALSVTELEKQLLQPLSSQEPTKTVVNNDNLLKSVPITTTKNQMQTPPQSISPRVMTNSHSVTLNSNLYNELNSISMSNSRLMTPAEFQTLRIAQSPVLTVSAQQNDSSSCHHCQHQQSPSINHFSKDNLRQLLVDMLQNDEEFVTGLHNAYIAKQTILRHIYS